MNRVFRIFQRIVVCLVLALAMGAGPGCGDDPPREGGPCAVERDSACVGIAYLICTAGTWKRDPFCECKDTKTAVCA